MSTHGPGCSVSPWLQGNRNRELVYSRVVDLDGPAVDYDRKYLLVPIVRYGAPTTQTVLHTDQGQALVGQTLRVL